jgi:fatty acid synthase subunit alpha
VCILQGPVAVKHSMVKDEPIKEMLDGIVDKLVDRLLHSVYKGQDSLIPRTEYLGHLITAPGTIRPQLVGNVRTFSIANDLPDEAQWLQSLAGEERNWLQALISTPIIVQGTSYIENPIRSLLAARRGQRVRVHFSGSSPTSLTVFGAARSHGVHNEEFQSVKISYDSSSMVISLTMFEERNGTSVPLHLLFRYCPSQGYCPIHEVVDGRSRRIKEFYWKLWFGDSEALPRLGIKQKFKGPTVIIDEQAVDRFCAVVGNQGELFKPARNDIAQAPMDFAIVVGWQVSDFHIPKERFLSLFQAIIQAIFPEHVDGDLLKLVHLSNGFKMLPGAKPLKVGDSCESEAEIASVVNSDSGKAVKVKGRVLRNGQPVMEVVSSFLYRGRFTDFANTFETVDEEPYVVEVANETLLGILKSKEWLHWSDDSRPLVAGTTLHFSLQSVLQYKDKAVYSSVAVSGNIYVKNQVKELEPVGTVDFCGKGIYGNPVIGFLQRHGRVLCRPTLFENGGYALNSQGVAASFKAPFTNEPYSKISGDFNPIHINPYFSSYARLPGTITHGLWTSAATRKFVETVASAGDASRVLS